MNTHEVVTLKPRVLANLSREEAEAIDRYYEGKLQPGDMEVLVGRISVVRLRPPCQSCETQPTPELENK